MHTGRQVHTFHKCRVDKGKGKGKSREMGDANGHTDEIWALAISPDGKYLATGCVSTVQLYDTNMSVPACLRSTPLRTQPRPSDNPRGRLHFTPELRQKSHRPARPAPPARQLDASIKKSAGSTETDLDDKLSRFGRVEQVVIA